MRPGVRAHLGAALRLVWLAFRHGTIALRLAVAKSAAGLVAIVVLFWEWGWKPLADLLGRLARLTPIARLEDSIRRLPPYAALAAFVLPSLLLFPLKLLALYLLAHSQKLAAVAVFVGAKVVGTALVARIFMLTQTALMQLAWFKRLYDWIMPLKAALLMWARDSAVWHAMQAIKLRVKTALGPLVRRLVAHARGFAATLKSRLLKVRPGGGDRG